MINNIAVLIPCYNEEITIKKVIDDFREVLPEAKIYVYDNNSSDNTSKVARESGAIVREESLQGKGNVIRSMFIDIDADIYVMADGDDTYPASMVHYLIKPILHSGIDMVIGDRHSENVYKTQNDRPLHNFGNRLVVFLINKLFKSNLNDIMSGYRVFNRKFVKNVPLLSEGFEIETEMTLQALDKRFKVKEIPITYQNRPAGSFSKLNTYTDGAKVLKTIFWLFKDYKPLLFFTIVSTIMFILAIAIGTPVVVEFVKTSYVERVPSAILAAGLMIISVLSLSVGLILDTVVKHSRESFEVSLRRSKSNYD